MKSTNSISTTNWSSDLLIWKIIDFWIFGVSVSDLEKFKIPTIVKIHAMTPIIRQKSKIHARASDLPLPEFNMICFFVYYDHQVCSGSYIGHRKCSDRNSFIFTPSIPTFTTISWLLLNFFFLKKNWIFLNKPNRAKLCTAGRDYVLVALGKQKRLRFVSAIIQLPVLLLPFLEESY